MALKAGEEYKVLTDPTTYIALCTSFNTHIYNQARNANICHVY